MIVNSVEHWGQGKRKHKIYQWPLTMMLCQPKVLETLLSVLVHVALSLQKHTEFLHPDLQQTTNTHQNMWISLINDENSNLSYCHCKYLMGPICKMHALKQKGFLTRLSVWIPSRSKLHCHSFHVHFYQNHRSLLNLHIRHIYYSSNQVLQWKIVNFCYQLSKDKYHM